MLTERSRHTGSTPKAGGHNRDARRNRVSLCPGWQSCQKIAACCSTGHTEQMLSAVPGHLFRHDFFGKNPDDGHDKCPKPGEKKQGSVWRLPDRFPTHPVSAVRGSRQFSGDGCKRYVETYSSHGRSLKCKACRGGLTPAAFSQGEVASVAALIAMSSFFNLIRHSDAVRLCAGANSRYSRTISHLLVVASITRLCGSVHQGTMGPDASPAPIRTSRAR